MDCNEEKTRVSFLLFCNTCTLCLIAKAYKEIIARSKQSDHSESIFQTSSYSVGSGILYNCKGWLTKESKV